jgi:hypothetical protein
MWPSLLAGLLSAVVAPMGPGGFPPPVVEGASRCILAYASWIVTQPQLAAGVMSFIVNAGLRCRDASGAAALALRALCSTSPAAFADPASFAALLAGYTAALSSGAWKVGGDDTPGVAAAAIMRVVSAMPSFDAASQVCVPMGAGAACVRE